MTMLKIGMPEMRAAGGKTKDAISATRRTEGPESPDKMSVSSASALLWSRYEQQQCVQWQQCEQYLVVIRTLGVGDSRLCVVEDSREIPVPRPSGRSQSRSRSKKNLG